MNYLNPTTYEQLLSDLKSHFGKNQIPREPRMIYTLHNLVDPVRQTFSVIFNKNGKRRIKIQCLDIKVTIELDHVIYEYLATRESFDIGNEEQESFYQVFERHLNKKIDDFFFSFASVSVEESYTCSFMPK